MCFPVLDGDSVLIVLDQLTFTKTILDSVQVRLTLRAGDFRRCGATVRGGTLDAVCRTYWR